MIIKCPECGHQVSDHAKTCPSCGIEIAGKVTRCPDCGEIIFKEEPECPNCHCPINRDAVVNEPLAVVNEPQKKQVPVAPPAQRSTEIEPQRPAKPAKKKNTGAIVFVTAVVIALIVVFVGIYFYKTQEAANEQRAYENALLSDQPAVLQNYLDMYMQASKAHRDTINAHLTVLKQIDIDWGNALKSGLKSELEKYIKRHPNSVHVVEAKLQIDSLDWVTACNENTQDAYQLYIRDHYDGAYYDEAMNAVERLREEAEARRRQAILDSIHVQDSIRAAQESSGIGGAIKSVLGL